MAETKSTSKDGLTTTEQKLLSMSPSNGDGVFYYNTPLRTSTASYSSPVPPGGRIPSGDVGGYADKDEAQGMRYRQRYPWGGTGSGWYKSQETAGKAVNLLLIALAAFIILK